jgi:hypothetical protein
MLYVLENSIPLVLDEDTNNKVMIDYQLHIDDNEKATCVMLATISLKFQT